MHTVLVVDDNKDIRQLIKRGLEFEGYVVLEAENGKDAQAKLSGPLRPCIVFLDLMMPVMDGRQFLEWKALQSGYSDIKVVVISAMSYDKKLLVGASEILRKPVDLDTLIELTQKFCA